MYEFKKTLAMLLVVSVGLTGCSKSDDGTPNPDNSRKPNFQKKDKNHPLPATLQNDYVSPEAKLVLSAVDKAKQQGKNLLVISSAAWCGPCTQLDQSLNQHPEVFTRLKKTHVILHIEEMHTKAGLIDFLPFTPSYWPMILIYRPSDFHWGIVDIQDGGEMALQLEKGILESSSVGATIDRLQAQYEQNIQNNVVLDDSKEGSKAIETLASLLTKTRFEKSADEVKALIKKIVADRQSKQNLFPDFEDFMRTFNWASYELVNSISTLVGQGEWSFDDVAAIYPQGMAYFNSGPGGYFFFRLIPELQGVRNLKNNSTAAKECFARLETYLSTVPSETPYLDQYKIKITAFCQTLSVQSGTMDKLAFETSMRNQLKTISKDLREAVLEDFVRYANSTELVAFAREFSPEVRKEKFERYGESQNELRVKITAAVKDGDVATADSLRAELATSEMKAKRVQHVYDQEDKFWAEGQIPVAVEEL